MPDHEVEEIDFPEGILRIAVLLRGGDPVGDCAGEGLDSSRVGPVVIASNGECRLGLKEGFEEFSHTPLDGAWIGPAETVFELGAAVFLLGRHAALSPQHAVGVIEQVACIGLDSHIMVKRKVLAKLKALESIDDYVASDRESGEVAGLKEQAMAAQTGNVMGHRRRRTAQCPCNLAVAHTADDHREDQWCEFWALLPIGSGECL